MPVIDRCSNKAYQRPRCRHDTVASPSRREVYTCCNYATRFPRLQRFLRHVDMTCEFCTERHPVTVDGEPLLRSSTSLSIPGISAWKVRLITKA
ncbi:hypothetical protein ABZT51_46450 [Streptomyces sp. NPDC005373]|uniref:hypothetical protein n=1 Tax=Streptomyces sp. NPDC005373 TaxID=3156879 RepID=UPI0033AFFD65